MKVIESVTDTAYEQSGLAKLCRLFQYLKLRNATKDGDQYVTDFPTTFSKLTDSKLCCS